MVHAWGIRGATLLYGIFEYECSYYESIITRRYSNDNIIKNDLLLFRIWSLINCNIFMIFALFFYRNIPINTSRTWIIMIASCSFSNIFTNRKNKCKISINIFQLWSNFQFNHFSSSRLFVFFLLFYPLRWNEPFRKKLAF